MLFISIIGLLILVLSFKKKLVDTSTKIQALEKFTKENNAILTDKLQALENLTKTDNRDIQKKTG